jgi:hypothetical protein
VAKFSSKGIEFKDYQKARFGTDDDAELYWDDARDEMTITTVISGVDPTEPGHLTTRRYVDDATVSGIDEFIELIDTPTAYSVVDYTDPKYVRIKSDGSGLEFAPAIVGTTSTGTTPPTDSNLWYNEYYNEFFYYDPDRGDWLSLTVHNYLFTYQGITDGLYMSIGDLRHLSAHYLIPRPATITAVISAAEEIFNSAKLFEVRDDTTTVSGFNHTNWEYVDMGANIHLDEGTKLKLYVSNEGNKIRNPFTTFEIRWRYVEPE